MPARQPVSLWPTRPAVDTSGEGALEMCPERDDRRRFRQKSSMLRSQSAGSKDSEMEVNTAGVSRQRRDTPGRRMRTPVHRDGRLSKERRLIEKAEPVFRPLTSDFCAVGERSSRR